jgi:hypothetical protein
MEVGEWRSKVVLKPHPVTSKENNIFADDGPERVIKVSSIKTLSCVAFAKPLGLF